MKNFVIQNESGYLAANSICKNSSAKKINANGINIILIAFLLNLISVFTTTIQAQWINVGPAGFSTGGANYVSLALLGSTPFVAFSDQTNGNKTTVMKFDGINWDYVGTPGFSASGSSFHNLVFNGSTLYVSFSDGGYGGRTRVMKFDGTSWANVGAPGFSAGVSGIQSLAFEGSTPYLAYQDGIGGRSTVMKFNGTDWENVGIPRFSPGRSEFNSLAFIGSTPYIAYSDGTRAFKSTAMKFDGSSWVYVGSPGFSPERSGGQNLVIDGSTPYVAFALGETFGNVASVMKFDGSNWVYVGPFAASGPTGWISLAINGSTPYLAYEDIGNGFRSTVVKYDGINWVTVGSPGFSAGYVSYLKIAFGNNVPFVSYSDYLDGNRTTVMTLCPFTSMPSLSISNAFLNGIPISLNCGSTIVINHDPLHPQILEFDVTGTDADFPDDQITMTAILPDPDCNIVEFNPSLPIGPLHSNIVSHVTVSPNPLAGSCASTLTLFVKDSCGNKDSCIINFDNPLPVELSSFSSSIIQNNVMLNWSTASETNNSGFDVERSVNGEWSKVNFVQGHGTTSTPSNYEFTDRNLQSGKYNYRLKQIDFNGNFEYFNLSNEVTIGVPEKFELSQNYPNPFNPTTRISYNLPFDGMVSLKVFDVSGREVMSLTNEIKTAGYYEEVINGSNLSSGVYFYRLSAEGNGQNFVATKKMLMTK